MLKWLLIGIALVIAWYILAPLFTPGSLKERLPRRDATGRSPRRARRKGPDLEVIDGEGRVIE